MKKLLLLTTALCAMASAMAKPVSLERASSIADSFFPGCTMQIIDFGEFYLYAPQPGPGFVIVAADDCVRPVLAYSLTASFPVAGMPPHVEAWIEGYRREIASLVSAGATPSEEVASMWRGNWHGTKTASVVAPLLTTTWNQAPLYNLLCPYDEQDSAYCVTGCTATATAQIMKYWNHPAVGVGSYGYGHQTYGYLSARFDTTHYRWNLMPNALTSLSDSAEVMAVAELMYHVGVAVRMNYSPSASGAMVNSYGYAGYPSAETALRTYFKYSPMLYSIYKAEHSDTEWDAMIANEIEASRPVLYAGYDTAGGHAFVLDGIDSTGMFHVNWGWGGAYDGYYTTDSLSPGAGGIGGNATYTFNMNNSAVIGIAPIASANDSIAVVDMRFDPAQGTVDGNGTYTPLADNVTVVARGADGYRFLRWQSGSTENPLQFTICGDLRDSAIFEPIALSDTAGYCADALLSAWHDDYSDTTEWGIRIPAAMRHGHRSLSEVLYVPYQQGDMTLNIYIGDSIDESAPAYTAMIPHNSSYTLQQWNSHRLAQPLWLNDDDIVWVTLRAVGEGYPATMSSYCGNSDATWYRLPDGWQPYDRNGVFYTWMLRAVFEERLCRVSVQTNMSDESMALVGISVIGAGDYPFGDTACIDVYPGICFDWGWGDDETSYGYDETDYTHCFQVNGDTVIHVWFGGYCIGIDDVEPDGLAVSVDHLTLTVDNPNRHQLTLFDIQGRTLATHNAQRLSVPLPTPGVYMLQAEGMKARRIVVIK